MAGINRHTDASTASQGQSEGRMGKGQGLLGTQSRYSMSAGDWEPTTVYLVGFVVLEIVAYAGLRYAFRGVHGG